MVLWDEAVKIIGLHLRTTAYVAPVKSSSKFCEKKTLKQTVGGQFVAAIKKVWVCNVSTSGIAVRRLASRFLACVVFGIHALRSCLKCFGKLKGLLGTSPRIAMFWGRDCGKFGELNYE